MAEFSITCSDFEEGGEIPKRFGYKHGNLAPSIHFKNIPENTKSIGLIMDDPDAMAAVGKIWVHWLFYERTDDGTAEIRRLHPDMPESYLKMVSTLNSMKIFGKNDFGELRYGGPAPPDKRHTYIFKAYALDVELDLNEGYSKQELEDAMKGHIIAEAKLTGTFAP